jgi:ADP-ribosylglycohydrolase
MDQLTSKAQGRILCQFIGDSIGSLVEFIFAESVKRLYSVGVWELHAGSVLRTIAWQPMADFDTTDFTDFKLLRE